MHAVGFGSGADESTLQQIAQCGGGDYFFGDVEEIEIARPRIPDCDEWSNLTKLNKEKELIGIYLSAHPLDNYKLEMETFCNTKLSTRIYSEKK